MASFALQFPAAEVPELAGRFSYAQDDGPPLRAGAAAVRRGFYTFEELETVGLWKTPSGRTLHLLDRNTDQDVTFATREALGPVSERERMDAVCWLWGVDMPTGSALLYFAFPNDYPIIDVRALQSLGEPKPRYYSSKFWEEYLAFCRQIAREISVPIRTLDKALWQASKERQASKGI